MKRCSVLAGVVLVFLLLGGMAHGQGKVLGQGKLNVNTATIEEFQLLPGVGESTAKSVLAYRKENGPFKSVDDLQKVKGIGKKKLDSLRVYIKLEGKSDFEPAKKKSARRNNKTSS